MARKLDAAKKNGLGKWAVRGKPGPWARLGPIRGPVVGRVGGPGTHLGGRVGEAEGRHYGGRLNGGLGAEPPGILALLALSAFIKVGSCFA